MRIYLDSSAIVKRSIVEQDSEALRVALRHAHGHGARLLTSALARVEVSRTLRTLLDSAPVAQLAVAGERAMSGIDEADLTRPVLHSARIIGPPALWTLDAIHLATAIALGVDELWTYDRRMAAIAEQLGLVVVAPR